MIDQIFKATITDVDELNVLINSAYRGDSAKLGWTNESDLIDGKRIDELELKRLLVDPNSTILKYVSKGKIIGCVLLQEENQEMYLGMLTVKPIFQSTGIGKKLLSASEQFTKAKKYHFIKMTVISVRSELIDFYKRHGYMDTGKRAPFPNEEERFGIPKTPLQFIVMSKEIN